MISARSGRSDVTDILVEGEHIDLDIQENVRICNHVQIYSIQGIHIHIHTCTCTCVYRYKCTYLQCSSYLLPFLHCFIRLFLWPFCYRLCSVLRNANRMRVCVCVYPPSSQSTGWSALHFAAERGDVTTSQSLLKAGANALLKDKVCVSHNYWPSHLPSFNPPHSSSSTQ